MEIGVAELWWCVMVLKLTPRFGGFWQCGNCQNLDVFRGFGILSRPRCCSVSWGVI